MPPLTLSDLTALAGGETTIPHWGPGRSTARHTSSWEITTFLLPMSIGHFRRVLRNNPDLPQGVSEEGTATSNAIRWFTFEEVEQLRRFFLAQGRKPAAPKPETAPLVTLVQPYGRAGKTTGVLHLAHGAALSGLRVLVIDADPAGEITRHLATDPEAGLGVLPLIARSFGGHLLRANQLRLDQGEMPQPMEDAISRALGLSAQDVIQPSRHPNIDLIAAPRTLALADMKLGDWQGSTRTWQPWRALHNVIQRDGLSETYDVIFCDTGAGAGPLALAMAASSDVLVMPVPVSDPRAEDTVAAGLLTLADAFQDIQTRENRTARALGQAGLNLSWRGVHLLLNGEDASNKPAAARLRARFGTAVLPDSLPEITALRDGSVAQFYDIAPRDMPRAVYTPVRQGVDACWQGFLTNGLLSWSDRAV